MIHLLHCLGSRFGRSSPFLFVEGDSSLKEGDRQMLILAYAAIKRLRNNRKQQLPLKKQKGGTSSFTVTCTLQNQVSPQPYRQNPDDFPHRGNTFN